MTRVKSFAVQATSCNNAEHHCRSLVGRYYFGLIHKPHNTANICKPVHGYATQRPERPREEWQQGAGTLLILNTDFETCLRLQRNILGGSRQNTQHQKMPVLKRTCIHKATSGGKTDCQEFECSIALIKTSNWETPN